MARGHVGKRAVLRAIAVHNDVVSGIQAVRLDPAVGIDCRASVRRCDIGELHVSVLGGKTCIVPGGQAVNGETAAPVLPDDSIMARGHVVQRDFPRTVAVHNDIVSGIQAVHLDTAVSVDCRASVHRRGGVDVNRSVGVHNDVVSGIQAVHLDTAVSVDCRTSARRRGGVDVNISPTGNKGKVVSGCGVAADMEFFARIKIEIPVQSVCGPGGYGIGCNIAARGHVKILCLRCRNGCICLGFQYYAVPRNRAVRKRHIAVANGLNIVHRRNIPDLKVVLRFFVDIPGLDLAVDIYAAVCAADACRFPGLRVAADHDVLPCGQ